MAKLSFKDMIFKVLRKDEDSKSMTYVPNMAYVLKFAKSKKGQISTAYYKSKSNAEKALASLKKDGINGIITKQQNVGFQKRKDEVVDKENLQYMIGTLKKRVLTADPEKKKDLLKRIENLKKQMSEDAPANATGTAVVGTGDDSSTIVMKKKKDKETMKDRLLRRFKIKETIDRTVPDLERPKDDIKEKAKMMKSMALKANVNIDEAIKGLQNKAKKTGMPYSILKKVYDRGMAAWKGGHRPGTTQQQWAFARVNSFVTKSSGTWGKADKDLADKVRASKG